MKSRTEFNSDTEYYTYLRAFYFNNVIKSMLVKTWYASNQDIEEHVNIAAIYVDKIIEHLSLKINPKQ